MSIEPALISFAGLTTLTAAMPKHRSRLALGATASPRAAHTLGWALLAIAAATAIARTGPAFGVVAWIGQLSVACVLLVLLMSWRPAYAPAVAILALATAPLLAL